MGKIDWTREKEEWNKYFSEHVSLLDDRTFQAVWGKMKHGVGGIDTVAMTLVSRDGRKDFLFNWEEIKRTAGDFAPRLLEYLALHEMSESWLVFKRGFNLRKDVIEKSKKGGHEGRPMAHLLALRKEYLAAWENGDLEQLHGWWREWMNEKIREMEEKGESSRAEKQRENLQYREKEYGAAREYGRRRAA